MDRKQIVSVFTLLSQAYPKEILNKETIELYRQLLSDCDYEDVKVAVLEHVKNSKFFPTIAELRERVADLKTGPIPGPDEAWSVVSEAIRAHGRMDRPRFEFEAIERTVKCIGWSQLCESENPRMDKSYFAKLYAKELEREKNAAMGKVVALDKPRFYLPGGDGA